MVADFFELPVNLVHQFEWTLEFDLLVNRVTGSDLEMGNFAGTDKLAIPAVVASFGVDLVALFDVGVRLVH